MDGDEQAKAASLLLEAYATRYPIDRLTETFPSMTLADAYAIQALQTQSWLAAGATLYGHKVGLTSLAMQQQMGVDQPDFGVLLDSMAYQEYELIGVEQFIQPRVEPEVAFVLRAPLTGPGVTVADAVRAVDWVFPALELIDSRIRNWEITFLDTVADNASSGGFVLGDHPVRLSDTDLRGSGCLLMKNGDIVATGAGGAVLGSPIFSLVWLANTLGRFGVGLETGHVVLPGSITPSIPVAAGETFTATFAGLGSVSAKFG